MSKCAGTLYIWKNGDLRDKDKRDITTDNENYVLVYYSALYRSIAILTNMPLETLFYKEARKALGAFVIHNNVIKKRKTKEKADHRELLRYDDRIKETNKIFTHIELQIKSKKTKKR